MKMSKRILSAILAVLMIVTMLPSFAVTVFAEEAKYVPVSAAGKEVVANDTYGLKNVSETDVAQCVKDLDAAMLAYEDKMNEHKLYTNLLDAYIAYQTAFKLFNSKVFDLTTTDASVIKGVTSVTKNLTDTTNNMTEFVPNFDTYIPTKAFSDESFTGVSDEQKNTIYKNNFKSLAFVANPDTDEEVTYTGSENNNLTVAIAVPASLVAIYDGSSPIYFGAMPVYKGGSSSKKRALKTFYSTSDVITTDADWKFRNTTGTYDFCWSQNAPNGTVSHLSSYATNNTTIQTSSGDWYKLSGHLVINPTFAADDSTCFTQITDNVTFTGVNNDSDLSATTTAKFGELKYYVLNYKALTDALSDCQSNLTSYVVSDYKWGGMRTVLSALDAATSFNPYQSSKYDYNINIESAVKKAASDIASLIKTLKSVKPNYEDAKIYDPTGELESDGDNIKMDGVAYTHAKDSDYTMYGNELSDNPNYGEDGTTGERVTFIKSTYPYYIDTENPVSIYPISSESVAQRGYTFSDVNIVDTAGSEDWYYDNDDGTTVKYNETTDMVYDKVTTGKLHREKLYKKYYVTGDVSNYFHYHYDGDGIDEFKAGDKEGYPTTGVELAIVYTSKYTYNSETGLFSPNKTGKMYGEYEFPYIMPNPADAHQIVGTRNGYYGGTDDRRFYTSNYSRFIGSVGTATSIYSKLTHGYDKSTGKATETGIDGDGNTPTYKTDELRYRSGLGNFKYLSCFGNEESTTADYTRPATIADKFNFYDKRVGTQSGSFAMSEHNDTNENSYMNSSAVVDADYYVDYSDTGKYGNLITVENGKPTGYKFQLLSSNLKWSRKGKNCLVTSYFRNDTGLNVDFSTSTTLTDSSQISDRIKSFNEGTLPTGATIGGLIGEGQQYGKMGFKNVDFVGYAGSEYSGSTTLTQINPKRALGAFVKDSEVDTESKTDVEISDAKAKLLGNPIDSNKFGIAFDKVYAGEKESSGATGNFNGTNEFTGTVTFTGKNSVNKGTDTSSAENYANFVLENGNYWSVRYLASVGKAQDATLGEETYNYYNVGVHTCDKGATRQFIEAFCNKKLNITYYTKEDVEAGTCTQNDVGKIKAIAVGKETSKDGGITDAIVSSLYSVSSYRAYLDAVAEAYWFVENPYNTTYTDSDGNTKEYTTAYRSDGIARIYSDDIDSDVFGTGTTNTDEVQAKLIQNILEAYSNLYTKEEYINGSTIYGKVKAAYEDKDAETGKSAIDLMTEDSKNSYKKLMQLAEKAYGFDPSDEAYGTPKYWRNVDLNGKEYKDIENMLKALYDISSQVKLAMPAVEQENLIATVSAKSTELADTKASVDENGKLSQMYSYSSWKNLSNKIDSSNSVLTNTIGKDKYKNGIVNTISIRGEKFSLTTLPFSEDATEEEKNQYLSDDQIAVNDSDKALKATTVKKVDTDDAYTAFDNAYTVVSSLDTDKYTDEGKNKLTSDMKSAHDIVYVKLTDAQAKEFVSNYTGSEGLEVRATSLDETDPQTSNLLTLNTEVNDTSTQDNKYIKRFVGTLTVADKDGNPVDGFATQKFEKYYGEEFNFSVDAITDKAVGQWSSTNFAGTASDYDADNNKFTSNATSSQKNFAYQRNVNRIADTNVLFFVKLVDDNTTAQTYTVKFYNVYNRCFDVVYTSTQPDVGTKGATYYSTDFSGDKNTSVAFYTLTGWNVTQSADDENVYIAKSVYEPGDVYTYNVYDGKRSTTFTSPYDRRQTVNYNAADTSDESFAAWANKAGDKYQIISYSKSYSFFAYSSDNLVPVIKKSDGYYAVENADTQTKLTTSNVDGIETVTIKGIDAEQYLNDKLTQKAPFVYIVSKDNSKEAGRYTAFCRVTQGTSANISAVGIMYATDNTITSSPDSFVVGTSAVKSGKINNILSTGQFTVTTGTAARTYRAYVDYDYSYTEPRTGKTTVLNTRDYGNIK